MPASLSLRRAAIVPALLLATALPARADITAFIGTNTTPDNRSTRGFALGVGLLVVGFEFEYANTSESTSGSTPAPGLRTGTGSVLLQTPMAIGGFQPYFIMGGGVYRETLDAHTDTSFTVSTGGGVKVNLVGPLRLRADYRVFKLGSGALYSPAHRVYAGLNLKF